MVKTIRNIANMFCDVILSTPSIPLKKVLIPKYGYFTVNLLTPAQRFMVLGKEVRFLSQGNNKLWGRWGFFKPLQN